MIPSRSYVRKSTKISRYSVKLSVIALFVGAQAAKAQDMPTPSGTIEGSVLNLVSGTSLKKATVNLVGRPSSPKGGKIEKSVETDANGHFVFNALDAGAYQLRFSRQGFVDQAYGGKRNSVKLLVLPDGGQLKDIVVRLIPLAIITGRVVDADGESVADVRVSAFQARWLGGKREWTEVAANSTSDKGEYRLPLLPPGTYLVKTWEHKPATQPAQADDSTATTQDTLYPGTFYPSATEEAAATPLRLEAGRELSGIDFQLSPVNVFRIRGSFVKPSGVSYVELACFHDGVREWIGPASDSHFEITGLVPGVHIIEAEPEYAVPSALARAIVSITDHNVNDVELRFASGFDVDGAIKVPSAEAAVDFRGITVSLGGLDVYNLPHTKVEENGTFILKGVTPTHARIEISEVPDCCYLKSIRFGGVELPDEGVDLSPGRSLEITLSPMAGKIVGSVLDKDEIPVVNATIVLFPNAGRLAEARSVRADEYGGFRVGGLKPGDYKLIAWDDMEDGWYFDPEVVKLAEDRAQTISVTARGSQTVRLKTTSEH
jgi:hypothetical protein